jgi:flavodoxin
MSTLLVVSSPHHGNTERIAKVFAEVLGAQIVAPENVDPGELHAYGLIGFGSGIYHAKHHQTVLELADRLQETDSSKAFIFSTYGAPAIAMTDTLLAKNHASLREKLQSKGYTIAGDFSCQGLNTNSFLKFFGGMNKGRPNADDLNNARAFAVNLKQQAGDS